MIAITDKSGISSAQNLQITALAVSGIGISDTHMAQPTKKMIVFIDTDRTFFIQYTSLSNSNINVSTQKARRNLTKITAGLMVGLSETFSRNYKIIRDYVKNHASTPVKSGIEQCINNMPYNTNCIVKTIKQ